MRLEGRKSGASTKGIAQCAKLRKIAQSQGRGNCLGIAQCPNGMRNRGRWLAENGSFVCDALSPWTTADSDSWAEREEAADS